MLTSFMAFVVRYLVLGLAAAAVFVAGSSATAHARRPTADHSWHHRGHGRCA